jgi:hypothetical protein
MPFASRVSENPVHRQSLRNQISLLPHQNAEQTKNTNITNKSFENALKFKHAYMRTTQLRIYSRREEQIKYQENL